MEIPRPQSVRTHIMYSFCNIMEWACCRVQLCLVLITIVKWKCVLRWLAKLNEGIKCKIWVSFLVIVLKNYKQIKNKNKKSEFQHYNYKKKKKKNIKKVDFNLSSDSLTQTIKLPSSGHYRILVNRSTQTA